MDFTINVQEDVQFYHLQAGGNSMEISKQMVGVNSLGYDDNGIIIYNNGGEFYAFDRTCPHDFPKSIAVEGDNAGSCKCPECGSVFLFPGLGFPASGSPSKYPLKEYKALLNPNNGSLRVVN